MSRRGVLGVAVLGTLAFAAVDWARNNVEIATLHVSGGATDYYARVFIVDDPPVLWVRAERPDRLWLAPLRSNPDVAVQRGVSEVTYHAEVWNGEASRDRIDRLFRAKYGAIDRVAAWIWRRDEVLIRLDPRTDFASGF